MSVCAQVQQGTPRDKKTDSLFTERVVDKTDSLMQPYLKFGALITDSVRHASVFEITKYDRLSVRYHSFGELLERGTPFMPLSHGGFGQHDVISILGGTNADIAVSIDGRPLYEPWSGQFHLSQVAPEALETTEILTGAQAIGKGATMSLSAVNLQNMQHNTATPYTSMWYSQGGGDLIAADVSFSQNVASGLNLTLGVRRSGALGRYTNTDFDVWNVRISLRYTADSLNHFGFSYNLASHNTDLWGGLKTVIPLTEFTERTAPPVFFDLRDESRRHDFTLSVLHFFDSDRRNSVSAQLYASTDDMLRIRDTAIFTSGSDTLQHLLFHGKQVGGIIRSHHDLSAIRLDLGVGADVVDLNATTYNNTVAETRPQAFGMLTVPIGSLCWFGSARAALVNKRVLVGVGTGFTFSRSSSSYTIDVSSIQRAPSAAEGLNLNPERQTVFSASMQSNWPMIDVKGQLFYRVVTDRITTITNRDDSQVITSTGSLNSSDPYSFAGATFSATIRTSTVISEQGVGDSPGWWLEFTPVVRSFLEPDAVDTTRTFPLVYAQLGAAFVYQTGKNSVRIGATGSIISPMASMQYVPLTWTYTQAATPQDWAANGLDVFLQAMLGNASVRLAYENILAQRFYTTAVAPAIIRDIRLSVTWSFFD